MELKNSINEAKQNLLGGFANRMEMTEERIIELDRSVETGLRLFVLDKLVLDISCLRNSQRC